MARVYIYSLLLLAGLIASQFLGGLGEMPIKLLTMFALAYIMIHVGYEFEIDKSNPGQYVWDYVVAATAAAFPWILCALYFALVMSPSELWLHGDLWKESLLVGRFASPTSAGVLFSMLFAAGLAATWVYQKARILAIFDDLDTILLMLPLTFLMIGFRWQLLIVMALMILLLWLAWRYLDSVGLPSSWPYAMAYSAALAFLTEAIYLGSKWYDPSAPIHLEVLLPAFVLGCILAPPGVAHGKERSEDDESREDVFGMPVEKRVSAIVTSAFMVLVGLSMPTIHTQSQEEAGTDVDVLQDADAPDDVTALGAAAGVTTAAASPYAGVTAAAVFQYAGVPEEILLAKLEFPGWPIITLHVLAITVISNLGKMFPLLCYRREANWRERLAVAVCMFPRGEVGAGVLVVSLSYGLSGPVITVAVLSLAVNLVLTGGFIVAVKRLVPEEISEE